MALALRPGLRCRHVVVVAGCTLATLLAVATQQAAAAPTDAGVIAARLAADTDRLAEARTSLVDVRRDLRAVRRQHARLRISVERRIVAIYMSGGAPVPMTTVAAHRSMRDVGQSLDTLDIVTEHERQQLQRWRRLGRRITTLSKRRRALQHEIDDAEHDVERGRARLESAQARIAAARAAAERMARIQDSPLLSKVGHPETVAVEAAGGAAAESGADGSRSAASAPPPAPEPSGFQQSGAASMYADSFSGEETANGERYDPNAFTAAHPSLPFGSWVTVHGPNGTVAVRINDRGPFVGGRIIDLSRAAANAVGLGGVGQVNLTVG